MNDRINLSYFAYGNRDFPFLKKASDLPEPSASVKTSGANILQRNYLNFEPGILSNITFNEPKNIKKLNNSRSTQNLKVSEKIFNKYHPEYKLYHNTKEQVIELNDYLNPIKQFLFKDNPKIRKNARFISLKKIPRYYDNDKNDSTEINKEKIILKNPTNNTVLIPNTYKMKDIYSLPKINKDENKEHENLKYYSFIESKESPEYLRNYDVEAFKNIDNYYLNKNENLHVLSRFGNWITLKPNDKNRKHALEKVKHGIYETSIVAPEWMDIASRRKINKKNYELLKRTFKSYQSKILRNNTKVTLLIDRDQSNARPIFLRDAYEKNRILLNSKNK